MTAATSIEERLGKHYAAAKARIYGAPRKVNIAIDSIRLRERMRKQLERNWINEAARAIAEQRAKDLIFGGFCTSGTAKFAPLQNAVAQMSCKVTAMAPRSMPQIARKVLKKHPGITMDDIRSDARTTPIMLARRHVIAVIRITRPDISYPAIGQFVEKDPTTCMHAVKMFLKQSGAIYGEVR